MKSKLRIFSTILLMLFLFTQIGYTEGTRKLSNVEDSLQSLVNRNTNASLKGEKDNEPNSENSGENQNWFSQHQKAWEGEDNKKEISEDKTSIKQSGEKNIDAKHLEISQSNSERSWIYYFFRTLVALALVIGLLFVVLGSIKFFVQRSPSKYGKTLGKVLGVVYLSPKAKVYYLLTGGKVVVLGVSGDSINLLFSMDEHEFFSNTPDSEELESGRNKDFQRILEDVEQRIKERSSGEENSQLGSDFDNDIASLKSDIQKLHKALREDSGDKEK